MTDPSRYATSSRARGGPWVTSQPGVDSSGGKVRLRLYPVEGKRPTCRTMEGHSYVPCLPDQGAGECVFPNFHLQACTVISFGSVWGYHSWAIPVPARPTLEVGRCVEVVVESETEHHALCDSEPV